MDETQSPIVEPLQNLIDKDAAVLQQKIAEQAVSNDVKSSERPLDFTPTSETSIHIENEDMLEESDLFSTTASVEQELAPLENGAPEKASTMHLKYDYKPGKDIFLALS